jgi:hypothetical protein
LGSDQERALACGAEDCAVLASGTANRSAPVAEVRDGLGSCALDELHRHLDQSISINVSSGVDLSSHW